MQLQDRAATAIAVGLCVRRMREGGRREREKEEGGDVKI